MSRGYASFVTRHKGLPHTCGVVADCRGAAPLSNAELHALARASQHPGAAAFGKIAVVRADGIAVYQADAGGRVAPTFCGNATAAAMRFLHGAGEGRAAVFAEAGVACETVARVDGATVTQQWLVAKPNVDERQWRGRRVIVLAVLNSYALVIGPLPEGVHAETARRELVGAGLSTKLAIVQPNGRTPIVEFHNANGRHGAAPQTGLATLAILVRSLPWFASLFPDANVAYATPRGSEVRALPPVTAADDGRLAIAMAPIDVDLFALVLGEAA